MENNNKLAKLSLAISGVLVIIVIYSFSQISSLNAVSVSNSIDNDTTSAKEVYIEPTGKIGFFNLDSLNSQLDLFKEIEQEMQNSSKDAENKMKKKQAEINVWEQKWSDRAPLMSTEQEQYMKEAQNMQNNAMEFEQNVQMKMQQEQAKLMETYAIRIGNQSKIFAELNGYDAIMAYTFGQSIWYYNPALDVTKDLAKVMNEDYAASTGNVEGNTEK
tara:strand:+ start:176 stop:826 length:651 start_codon:yes stop_codon:yes gene_type:complete